MIYVYLIIVGKREYCADVMSHNNTSFQITVPLSLELVSAVSDKAEEETRDFTLAHEDGSADDKRAV